MELTGRILSIGQTVNISCFWRRGYLLFATLFDFYSGLAIKYQSAEVNLSISSNRRVDSFADHEVPRSY